LKPPNEKGALRHAPFPKLLPGQLYHLQAAAQQPCPHSSTVTQRMPSGYVHHARVVCAQCGTVLKWLAKPATIERRQLNAFRLAQLSMCDGLNPWERRFVESLSRQKKFSPKQSQILDCLVATHLGGQVTP
jgi:hypothetical protein